MKTDEIPFLEKDILAFPQDWTIEETARELRKKALETNLLAQQMGYAYVVDAEGRLAGVIQMRDLVLNPPQTKLEAIMKTGVTVLNEKMKKEEMFAVFKQRSFLALPVVDEDRKLIGAVSFANLSELFQKKAGETLYQAMGMGLEELSHRSIWKMILLRSPWLILSILTGLAAAFILGNYFVGIETIISLVLFIPIVLGLSGSMARQCAVLVTHELSRGGATLGRLGKILYKETLLAVFAGLLTMVFVGLMAFFLHKNLIIAIGIGTAIFTAILASGCLGVFFPYVFVGLRLDPKIATGPLTVAVCDLFALWTYLQVAFYFLSHYMEVI